MSVAAEIDAMKAMLSVATDHGLSLRMGLSSAGVAHWRRNGRVPAHALERARLIAEHIDHPRDNMEWIGADIVALAHRLQHGNRMPAWRMAETLEALAARARSLETEQ